MNKKLLLSLGAISATALPIAAVISCGTNVTPSDEEKEAYKIATSDKTFDYLTNQWMEKVIATVTKETGADAKAKVEATQKALINQYLKINIEKDGKFLLNIGKEINKTQHEPDMDGNLDKYSTEWLRKEGVLKTYKPGTFTHVGDANMLTDKGYEFIMNTKGSKFKKDFNEFIVTYLYVLQTNKSNYAEAFSKDTSNNSTDLTSLQKKIADDHYVLINDLLTKKYFAQWTIELDKEHSPIFNNAEKRSFNDTLTAMKDGGDFFTHMKRSEQEAVYRNEYPHLVDGSVDRYSKMAGFKGISTLSSQGTGVLSFTEQKLQTVDDLTKLEGFIDFEKSDLITEAQGTAATDPKEITIRQDKADTVKVQYVKGIMPVYKNNKFTIEDEDYAKDAAVLVAIKDKADLFPEAKTYFTTTLQNRGAIILPIKNDEIKDLYENKYPAQTFWREARTPDDNE